MLNIRSNATTFQLFSDLLLFYRAHIFVLNNKLEKKTTKRMCGHVPSSGLIHLAFHDWLSWWPPSCRSWRARQVWQGLLFEQKSDFWKIKPQLISTSFGKERSIELTSLAFAERFLQAVRSDEHVVEIVAAGWVRPIAEQRGALLVAGHRRLSHSIAAALCW